MKSPITWFGGKGGSTSRLLPLLPYHHTYVEVFGGGASLLFAKGPSSVEVYNDINSGLVNLFRVLRDKKDFELFRELVELTPVSREEYYFCRDTWWQHEDDRVLMAYKFYVVAKLSFGGIFGRSFSFSVRASNNGMAAICGRWLSTIERLPEVHKRLMRVQVEHKDWRDILDTFDHEETLFYLDPPYLLRTRRSGGYQHELSDLDHSDLIDNLLTIKGMALLSGYPNGYYEVLERNNWIRLEWNIFSTVALQSKIYDSERNARTECVWVSPNVLRYRRYP